MYFRSDFIDPTLGEFCCYSVRARHIVVAKIKEDKNKIVQ